MVTKEDVARAAGVSTATITRVISGKGYTSPEARSRVMKAVEDLKYRPNKLASNLAKNSSNVIAVLVEDLLNPYYTHIVEAMVERANEKDYIVSLFIVKNKDMKLVLGDLIANRVCGIVNLAMFTSGEEQYRMLLEMGVKLFNFTEEDSNYIRVDYFQGMDQALDLLHDKGLRNVGFIVGLEENLAQKDLRVIRYLQRRTELGFSDDPRLMRYANYPKEKAHKVGYLKTIELIESGVKFDSLFCLTDMMAMGAIKALHEHSIRIPQDVSLIGCDNLDFTGYYTPALTTINVDKEAQGIAFVDYITGIVKESVVIPTRLKIRDSVLK